MARGERPRDFLRFEPPQAMLWVKKIFGAKSCQKKPKNFRIHIIHENRSFFDGRPESGVGIAPRSKEKKP